MKYMAKIRNVLKALSELLEVKAVRYWLVINSILLILVIIIVTILCMMRVNNHVPTLFMIIAHVLIFTCIYSICDFIRCIIREVKKYV